MGQYKCQPVHTNSGQNAKKKKKLKTRSTH